MLFDAVKKALPHKLCYQDGEWSCRGVPLACHIESGVPSLYIDYLYPSKNRENIEYMELRCTTITDGLA